MPSPTLVIPMLETPQLLLRPVGLSDVEAIQAKFARWDVVQYLNAAVPWPYPADGALTFVRDVALPAMRKGKTWHWSIRPKVEPDQLIGVISLTDDQDDNRGFWLDPDWRGKGLATEAADAVTNFWFETLERPVLRVSKAVANIPSRRISEKTGMRVIDYHERDYVGGRMPAELWEITRDEWRLRKLR